jgi:hypothetical protein
MEISVLFLQLCMGIDRISKPPHLGQEQDLENLRESQTKMIHPVFAYFEC